MSLVQKTRVVHAPIASTWTAVSKLGAVQDWHPNVAKAQVLTEHDSGIGASRRVEFQDGRGAVETVVEEVDHEFTTMEMTESPMMKKALVTIRTKELSTHSTEVTFSIDYRVSYGPIGWLLDVAMLRRVLRNVFDTALGGLSYHLETGEIVTDSIPAAALD